MTAIEKAYRTETDNARAGEVQMKKYDQHLNMCFRCKNVFQLCPEGKKLRGKIHFKTR